MVGSHICVLYTVYAIFIYTWDIIYMVGWDEKVKYKDPSLRDGWPQCHATAKCFIADVLSFTCTVDSDELFFDIHHF